MPSRNMYIYTEITQYFKCTQVNFIQLIMRLQMASVCTATNLDISQ